MESSIHGSWQSLCAAEHSKNEILIRITPNSTHKRGTRAEQADLTINKPSISIQKLDSLRYAYYTAPTRHHIADSIQITP